MCKKLLISAANASLVFILFDLGALVVEVSVVMVSVVVAVIVEGDDAETVDKSEKLQKDGTRFAKVRKDLEK